MTPAERFVRALREAAIAFEEHEMGKKRKVRRRGPLPLSPEERAKPISPEIAEQVEQKMVANGWRRR